MTKKDALTEEAIEIMSPAIKWTHALEKECLSTEYSKEDLKAMKNIIVAMKALICLFIEGECLQVKVATLLAIRVVMGDQKFVDSVMEATEKLMSGNYQMISVLDADLLFKQAVGCA